MSQENVIVSIDHEGRLFGRHYCSPIKIVSQAASFKNPSSFRNSLDAAGAASLRFAALEHRSRRIVSLREASQDLELPSTSLRSTIRDSVNITL